MHCVRECHRPHSLSHFYATGESKCLKALGTLRTRLLKPTNFRGGSTESEEAAAAWSCCCSCSSVTPPARKIARFVMRPSICATTCAPYLYTAHIRTDSSHRRPLLALLALLAVFCATSCAPYLWAIVPRHAAAHSKISTDSSH